MDFITKIEIWIEQLKNAIRAEHIDLEKGLIYFILIFGITMALIASRNEGGGKR